MSELQLWRDIATGVLGVLVLIIGYLWTTTVAEMKTKLSKEEFASYLDEAKQSRNEIRETLIKLFEKMESHEKLDASRFEGVVKDFNGGLTSIRDALNTSKLEIFDRINGKADR